MAGEGGIDMLITLLGCDSDHVQRQAAKAIANLGVNADNKAAIAAAGGIDPLVALADKGSEGVQIEAIAALANLAVNGEGILLLVPSSPSPLPPSFPSFFRYATALIAFISQTRGTRTGMH